MPGARWLGEHSPKRAMDRYDIVCLHTIVGYAPAHAAHFSVHHDGTIDQSRDTAYQSGANLDGNDRVIAIENEDHGSAFGYWNVNNGHAVPAFTAAQITANARILAWAHERHGIPLQLCPNSRPTSRGLAYHRQGIDGNFGTYAYPGRVTGGELWTSSPGKVCPGDRRISARDSILTIARQIVAGTEVDDMATTPADVWNHEIAFGLQADTMLSQARTFAEGARNNTIQIKATLETLKNLVIADASNDITQEQFDAAHAEVLAAIEADEPEEPTP
jgi:hypothetical protein